MKNSPDLFEYSLQEQLKSEAPLADRMRPRTLDQFVGQSHILAAGRLLRRAIQADQLSSLIFFGPPGTGKTTLARIIANTTKAQFISLNAVLSGVKEIRAGIAAAENFRKEFLRRTILFVDEVHRFNKAQQDALLPHVENGTVILIGATTENPYFEVNKALVSRSRIFQLKPLDDGDLAMILEMALSDKERGYGNLTISFDKNAKSHLVSVSNGDARALLNALELAVETSKPDNSGSIHIDLETAEESIQRKAVLYDKDGDAHFDTISAFIKSMRGSDPDAALYWMAKMVYGGEEPRFLFRRMIVFASEDVGMADPNALNVVMNAAQAFDYVGMPEGRFHLAQACIYLSTAPKSNSGFAFFDALNAVEKEKTDDVPDPIKDGNRDKEGLGHGKGYLYPHAYKDHWVAQQYLPDILQGRIFYQPSQQGFEAKIRNDVIRHRETQLASFMESSEQPAEDQFEYWQGRTMGNTAELLAEIRDLAFSLVTIDLYQSVLVLNAVDGVMLGEALRRNKEGSIYGQVKNQTELSLLKDRYTRLEYLSQPVLFAWDNGERPILIQDEQVHFDLILGKNSLSKTESNQAQLQRLKELLNKDGVLLLAESIPEEAQRLSEFIRENDMESDLLDRIVAAEVEIYHGKRKKQQCWSETILPEEINSAGFSVVKLKKSEFHNKTMISRERINQWFLKESPEKKSYADYLQPYLSAKEIKMLHDLLMNLIGGKVVNWRSNWVFVKAKWKP